MEGPETIHNWLRLDERLTTSGQPSEAQLAGLVPLGVTHVVNLALHTHELALADETGTVAALGMAYTHIPVVFAAPTEDDFQRFCDVMQSLEGEVIHVHCIMNWRVSAFMYRRRRDVLGWDEPVARADMLRIWQPDEVWTRFVGLPG